MSLELQGPAVASTPVRSEDMIGVLAGARRLASTIDTSWSPVSAEDAYAVQRGIRAQLGEGIGGWKAAGLDPDDIPLIAPVHLSDVSTSGALPCPEEGWILEVEYGYRLGRDLPGGAALPANEIMDAVAEVHVCFELCRSRLAKPSSPRLLFLADGLANDGVVVGSGLSPQNLSLGDRDVCLRIDGNVAKQVRTPDDAAATKIFLWLARRSLFDGGLKAGHVVITGSLTGTDRIRRGQTAEASIQGIGEVRLHALPSDG